MKITRIKIDNLKLPERNIRIHTEKQIDEFVRSVKMFGQIRPVVVDEDNTVLAGNGLVLALKKAGMTEAEVYKITNLSENQKKKLMIADNKIFNLGIENIEILTDFLNELGEDLDVPGYDEEILKTMVAQAEDVTAKICEYGTLDENEIEHIRNNSSGNDDNSEDFEDDTGENEPEMLSNENETKEQPTAEERRFILCPKCGEKIWL